VTRTRYLFADRALEIAAQLRPQIVRRLDSSRGPDGLRPLAEAVAAATGTQLSDEEFASLYAEAVACGTAVTRLAGPLFREGPARAWVLDHANLLWRGIIEESFVLASAQEAGGWEIQSGGGDPILAFYEVFLNRHDQRRRTRHGVFYTPPPIARFILSQAHRSLIDEFGLADGLADEITWKEMARRVPTRSLPMAARPETPFVRILDPALGTGVFLNEGVKLIHSHLAARWAAAGESPREVARRWDEYVAVALLPRWYALELMLPACIVATLKLAVTLADTGFSFTHASRLEIHLANTLAGPVERQHSLFSERENAFLSAAIAGRDVACHGPFTVIVGNPPFSGISTQQGRWIADLLRGSEGGCKDWCNYFEVDGQPLGERKTWLQDDYVKFLRFAQWKIETTGCGIVGLVTNHGYLDNPTFRGIRRALLATFPQLTVIDLHGNRKKKERAPDGGQDENVFAIEQGTAIGLFRRPPAPDTRAAAWHGELWGTAEAKLRSLDEAADLPASKDAGRSLAIRRLVPVPGQYFFAPRPHVQRDEYDASPSLPKLMPVNVTAPVTARDHFVVAFTREELLARMAEFRDLAVDDDELRQRYFTRTRSAKYAPGDTRGWKLAAARRRLAADPLWQEHVRPCWYRPFDERFVYWADGMIDWPRNEVTPYLVRPGNLALVARRQMLPTQPCNYFWVTDQLLLDGLIRSDNRGSESVFPLFLEPAVSCVRPDRINLDKEFLERAARQLAVRWRPSSADAEDTLCAADLFCYTYALFFSPTYRRRYADRLWSDFPRVLLPRRLDLFRGMAELGRQLAGWHLLRGLRSTATKTEPAGAAPEGIGDLHWSVGAAAIVSPGFPKFAAGRICLNRDVGLEPVPGEVWDFHAGGHQVCNKWLKDRRNRTLTQRDLAVYCGIVAAIDSTLRTMPMIDVLIQAAGGWPAAFVSLET